MEITMNDVIDLSKGGFAVVAVGSTGYVLEYKNNPQVKFLNCKEIPTGELQSHMPSGNIKAVIITEGLPQYHYNWLMSYCKRQNILYLIKRSNQAVYEQLKQFFPDGNGQKVTIEEVKETQSRGRLQPLLEMLNPNESNANEARRLIKIAVAKGIKTTEASLAQAIAIHKRKQGLGTVPKSARSKLDVSVELLDGMVKDLTDMREYLIATTEENRLLRTKVEKLKGLLGD